MTPLPATHISNLSAGMVKRYHGSFPSFSYEFDSRYPLQTFLKLRDLFQLRWRNRFVTFLIIDNTWRAQPIC